MSLAAITVHYQDPGATIRLVEALEKCDRIESILVVSHDSFQPENHGKVIAWQQPNHGYAAGLNFAVRRLDPRIQNVLAVNPDVTLECGQLNELYSYHLNSRAGCTFPVLKEGDRLVYGYRFSRFGSLLNVKDADWFPGACFLFSVDAWQKSGGFDESFFHYFEDRDFCLRARQAGFKLQQADKVILDHQGKSGRNYPETILPKYAVRNHLLSLKRSGLLGPATFLNVVIRNLAYLFRWKHPWKGIFPWFQGIHEFLTRDHSRVVE